MTTSMQTDRERALEEAAQICRAFARWNEDHIVSATDNTFAPSANAADDCAELIEKYARTGNFIGTNIERTYTL